MIVKGIIDEDFINYKVPSMVIEFPKCDFKCGKKICQNNPLVNAPDIEISYDDIILRYLNNPISKAIVLQGLEPFCSVSDVTNLIIFLRDGHKCDDDIVIYTGYTEDEIKWYTDIIGKAYKNIIIKFGRYVPDEEPHYDHILGVNLASDNQYALAIS